MGTAVAARQHMARLDRLFEVCPPVRRCGLTGHPSAATSCFPSCGPGESAAGLHPLEAGGAGCDGNRAAATCAGLLVGSPLNCHPKAEPTGIGSVPVGRHDDAEPHPPGARAFSASPPPDGGAPFPGRQRPQDGPAGFLPGRLRNRPSGRLRPKRACLVALACCVWRNPA